MILYSLLGITAGALLMMMLRQLPIGLLLVPVCVAIGPVLLAMRRKRPSRMFLVLYVLLTGALFTMMALTGAGFVERFDPP